MKSAKDFTPMTLYLHLDAREWVRILFHSALLAHHLVQVAVAALSSLHLFEIEKPSLLRSLKVNKGP